jgi:hypothetical protein
MQSVDQRLPSLCSALDYSSAVHSTERTGRMDTWLVSSYSRRGGRGSTRTARGDVLVSFSQAAAGWPYVEAIRRAGSASK